MPTAVIAIWSIAGILALAWIPLWRVGRKYRAYMNRNELFRVRSQLVRLVATDTVSPHDAVFSMLYELVNISIANTRTLNLLGFVVAARERGMPSKIAELIEKAITGSPELREVTIKYFEALGSVLLRNSPLLRFYLRFLMWTHRNGQRMRSIFPWLYEAGEIERACKRGAQRLAHVSA